MWNGKGICPFSESDQGSKANRMTIEQRPGGLGWGHGHGEEEYSKQRGSQRNP